MSVIFATAATLPREKFDSWCVVGNADVRLDPARRIPNLGCRLENAFDAIRDEWFALARDMGREPSAVLAHAPACAANASDFGLMLAWARIANDLAAKPETTLIVCDDPWLFRHLAGRPGIRAGRPPSLIGAEWRLRLRGFAARAGVAVRAAWAAIRLSLKKKSVPGERRPWILAYAHPDSAADGTDAYFGSLMTKVEDLARILHVDGPPARAAAICGTGKQTVSLHAFGSPLFALSLIAARWRPKIEGPNAWLVRRAAAREGGTGQAAMIAWQVHCQKRWLAAARPTVVAWPWENHSWERAFVRACRSFGARTIGCQHTTIGRREWNYASHSNTDGEMSIPDVILCAGQAWAGRLRGFGHRDDRLSVGGAWRMPAIARLPHDPAGPIFVALPSDHAVATEIIAAIQPLARQGMRFIVRDHPMTPFPFPEEPGLSLTRADGPLASQKGIAVVLYAGTTVGLEAALGGLPAIRFLPERTVANDVLPDGFDVSVAAAADLGEVLRQATPPQVIEAAAIFAPVDIDVWRTILLERKPT